MPEDKARKRAVRRRMARTGERYTTAARRLAVAGDPLTGCEDPTTALDRARALVETITAPGNSGSFWSARAAQYLAAYLRAAALGGEDTRALARWIRGEDPREAEEILTRAHAQQWASWLGELNDGRTPQTAKTVRLVMQTAIATRE